MIPSGWEIIELEKVLKKVRRPVNVKKSEEYKQIGIRSHGKGLFHKKAVMGEELGNKSVFWIEPDCFILNIVFAWEMAVGKTTENENGMIASHRFPMYKPKDSRIDIDYLTYYFKSPRGKYLLELASPGGAGRNKTLGQTEFMKLKIPFPPLKEQQKIASILATMDKAIKLKEDLIAEKKTQLSERMRLLVSGELRFDGYEGEWVELKINKIGNLKGGSGFPENEQGRRGNIPFFKVSDMNNNGNEKYMLNSRNYINTNILTSIKANLIPKGAIIFAKVGAALLLERKRILNQDSCIDNNMMALNVKDSYNIEFVYYKLIQTQLSRYANIGAIPSINSKDIGVIKLLIPPTKVEQERISNTLNVFDKETTLLEKELQTLKIQKEGLIQRLLTGIVRVNI